jgi:hypothetical protein
MPTPTTRSGRSYWALARANVFTFFNDILFVIGVALVALGQWTDAVMSVGLGLVNAVIGAAQEACAKRKLDRIALLSRPTVTVLREGRDRSIDPDEVVPGDVVHVVAGDQITADGRLLGEGRIEMDESLLTGETDLIAKVGGDPLLSGSFCVAGAALYEAEQVGESRHRRAGNPRRRAVQRFLRGLPRREFARSPRGSGRDAAPFRGKATARGQPLNTRAGGRSSKAPPNYDQMCPFPCEDRLAGRNRSCHPRYPSRRQGEASRWLLLRAETNHVSGRCLSLLLPTSGQPGGRLLVSSRKEERPDLGLHSRVSRNAATAGSHPSRG